MFVAFDFTDALLKYVHEELLEWLVVGEVFVVSSLFLLKARCALLFQGDYEQAIDRLAQACKGPELLNNFKAMLKFRQERITKLDENTSILKRDINALKLSGGFQMQQIISGSDLQSSRRLMQPAVLTLGCDPVQKYSPRKGRTSLKLTTRFFAKNSNEAGHLSSTRSQKRRPGARHGKKDSVRSQVWARHGGHPAHHRRGATRMMHMIHHRHTQSLAAKPRRRSAGKMLHLATLASHGRLELEPSLVGGAAWEA